MEIEFKNGSKIKTIDINSKSTRGKRAEIFLNNLKSSIIENIDSIKPYSDEDYELAKYQGLDLDDWNDYVEYYGLGEREEYE